MTIDERYIAGVDEAGRGPLAGPVSAAAVMLPLDYNLPYLTDSKKLSEKKSEYLYDAIIDQALSYAIVFVGPEEIDRINILQASLLAMQRAIERLAFTPQQVLIDGIHAPKINYPFKCIINGDRLEPSISAASILAKVTRDRLMLDYEQQYPGYGFAKHKGYPTKAHCQALQHLGVSPIHRRSFAPVKRILARTHKELV